ncbi:hypothetical protein DKT77_15215 [Meridianimarinicoccus roseus]|uniref:Uncharacterized protein n=1 Tax=Meridianimarinicoccus roseus TaxID=2072018 RepID=A0A2V2L854_9RHOB|nr:hypothetical protein [Meridianimarinicoccus roseus]PWR01492.1 hypothetical protein DKT77_15215 [Meridianimarinicoccus roseus]
MTVLSKYQRLECAGIWHPAADAQRRDVFVALGKASLIIKDANDTALAHWSLPAVERMNPGTRPALYAPGADADELLEIDDETMIDAIRTVGRALGKARARPGRLRRGVLLLSTAALAALAVWWLPGALTRHTAELMPAGLRGEIGQRLLRELASYAGQPCTSRNGTAALAELRRRILDDPRWSLVVVPSGPALSAHLPGRMILLRSDAIEGQDSPDLAAGLVLAEAARVRTRDPMLDLIGAAGLPATLRLLTRGEIEQDTLRRYAADFLPRPPVDVPAAELAADFAAAGVRTEPYGTATGSALPGPAADDTPPTRIVTDATWLRLRGICED